MSFAAALYGTAGSRKSYKPGKMDSFGCQFAGIIVLENSTLKPYGKITGQLAIDTGWPIKYHEALRLQVEAQCKLAFDTKIDGRVSLHKKYDNIMDGTGEMSDSYQTSPIMTDIEPFREPFIYYEIPAGNHRYRFNLNITGETLPAPFKTTYGTLKYKLVAYMLSPSLQWVQIGEKELRFSGFHNLSQNVDALKPVEIARVVKKSIFSSKKLLSCVLKLDSCAYLVSEELPFTLCVDNPKALSLKLYISLNQRCIYNIDGAKKTTVAVLDSCEHEVNEPGTEYAWVGFLNVHKAAAPSYCVHPMYTVLHILQFTVKVDDYSMVKGEVPISIGSTRETVELLISGNSLVVDENERFPVRRGSTTSTHSDCSGLSHFTLPPPYSELSSRAPSYETLPPPYDSEEDLLKVQKGKRRQSCIEFRVIPPEETSESNSPQPGNMTPATTPVTDD